MTKQTKTCKNLLKSGFPDIKFSVKHIKTGNYRDSSDRLEIRYDADIPTDVIISYLKRWTIGMKIDRIGKVQLSSSERFFMYDPTTKQTVDMDLCEFIEVGYK